MHRILIGWLAVGLVLTACAESEPTVVTSPGAPAGTPTVEPGSPASTLPTPDGEVVKVLTVTDGDSIAVDRSGVRTEVRLAGINAPESDECYGDPSRGVLSELIEGSDVVLVPVTDEDETDQFGRLLRDVFLGGTWMNEVLVRRGAALALQTGSPSEVALVAAENAAWADRVGMWDPEACGRFTPGVVAVDVNYDPPGADGENAADEFALIQNEGDATVDISGWIVRDESSQHRYVFPAGTTLTPGDALRLRSGCGTDSANDVYWCADGAVWSNGGDTVLLQTPAGTVASRFKYGGSF